MLSRNSNHKKFPPENPPNYKSNAPSPPSHFPLSNMAKMAPMTWSSTSLADLATKSQEKNSKTMPNLAKIQKAKRQKPLETTTQPISKLPGNSDTMFVIVLNPPMPTIFDNSSE